MSDQGFMFYVRHHLPLRIVVLMFLEESCRVVPGYKKGRCGFGRMTGHLLQCLLIMALCYCFIQPSLIYAPKLSPVRRQ